MQCNVMTIDKQLLHVSALLQCHHQGVLISVKMLCFELVCKVRHSHSSLTSTVTYLSSQSQAHSLTNKVTHWHSHSPAVTHQHSHLLESHSHIHSLTHSLSGTVTQWHSHSLAQSLTGTVTH